MSRIGKKPIEIPGGVEITLTNGRVVIKGPKGKLERVFDDIVNIEKDGNFLKLNPRKNISRARVLWGTYASIINNMIEGVTKGFSKNLIIEGIGYKAQVQGKELVLNLAFSHLVKMPIPEGIDISVEKNKITVAGIDKEQVGRITARIRAFKKPEPYKGKGIRYEGEIIRRKAGKKAVGVT